MKLNRSQGRVGGVFIVMCISQLSSTPKLASLWRCQSHTLIVQAADFMGDEHSVRLLAKQAATWLFAPETTMEDCKVGVHLLCTCTRFTWSYVIIPAMSVRKNHMIVFSQRS